MKPETGRIGFGFAILALAGVFFVAAVFAGRAMVISGHVYYNDLLFGVDSERNITILTEPGIHNAADMARSNVHPLFPVLVKPWAPLVMMLGFTKGVAGMIVNAAAGALSLLLAAWYLRRRNLAGADAWLLTLLMAASATWVCMSATPGMYIFSLNLIILSFILAQWVLARPDPSLPAPARWAREALWLAVGVVNYGITVTNGMMSFLAYGCSRRGWRGWLRAAVYGALVLGLGLAITVAIGSYTNMIGEKQWLVDDVLRGGTPRFMTLIALATPTVWSFVVPWPTLHDQPEPSGRIHKMAGITHWNYTGWDWFLAAACLMLLASAVRAALADRDPIGRRLSLGLALALAFHTVMHRFYYYAFEGVFFFTPHSIFLVVGLFAPLALKVKDLPPRGKWLARAALLALGIALALRNYHYFLELRQIIPIPS